MRYHNLLIECDIINLISEKSFQINSTFGSKDSNSFFLSVDLDVSLLTNTDSSIVEVGVEDTYNVSEEFYQEAHEYKLPFDLVDHFEPCLSPANPFNEPVNIFDQTKVDAELYQLVPNTRLSLRKDNKTGNVL